MPVNALPTASLFDRAAAPFDCCCGESYWCPCCGTWEPATDDQEILDAVVDNSRPSRGGHRVVRKEIRD